MDDFDMREVAERAEMVVEKSLEFRVGQAVIAACAPWPPSRIAAWIRDTADKLDKEFITTGGLPNQLRTIADALEPVSE